MGSVYPQVLEGEKQEKQRGRKDREMRAGVPVQKNASGADARAWAAPIRASVKCQTAAKISERHAAKSRDAKGMCVSFFFGINKTDHWYLFRCQKHMRCQVAMIQTWR